MRIFNLQEEHINSLYKQRISLDALYILERIYLGESICTEDAKCASLLQTLERKGYIMSDRRMSDAGKELYLQLINEEPVKKIKIPKLAIDVVGLNGIHKKLQDKLEELTGSKQYRADIKGRKYSFLCNETDLVNRLAKVIAKYKLTDFDKIEKTLLRYIEKCKRSNNFFPLIQYYIIKEKEGVETSELVTDMDGYEEKEKFSFSSQQKSIDI